MKTTTTFAIAAVASALLGTTSLLGSAARAADLGGSCCSDLEERIAELEATTVRKGNRKVSLQISGFVGSQVLFWNDGTSSDMYIGDGGNIFSRFRFKGEAKISPDVTAGFTYEFAANPNAITSMNQFNGAAGLGNSGATPTSTLPYAGCGYSTGSPQTGTTVGCAQLRDATVWLKSAHFGMVKIGQGSTSTDNLVLIDLAGLDIAATPDSRLYIGGFQLRGKNGKFASNGAATPTADGFQWQNALQGHESWDTNRREHVLYEAPTLYGFTLQAAVATDNYWDIALRYAGEHHGFRIAGGIGYQEDTDFNGTFQQFDANGTNLCNVNCNVKSEEVKGALSILHVSTGLFVTGAAGDRKISGTNFGSAALTGQYNGPDVKFFWLSAGLSKNFFGLGNTVLFGEYGEYKGGLAEQAFLGNVTQGQFCNSVGFNTSSLGASCDSTTTLWGIGVNQYIDAAAMEVFATYKNFSLDTNGFTGTNAFLNKNQVGAADIQAVIVGTKINF